MPKVRIESDERYPVFTYRIPPKHKSLYYPDVEVSQKTLDRWGRITKAYEAIQQEMATLTNKAQETPDEKHPDQG